MSGAPSQDALNGFFRQFTEVAKDQSGWTFLFEKLGVNVYQKQNEEDGGTLSKGEGVIKAPAEKVKDLLVDITQRPKWDLFFENGNIVKTLNDDMSLALVHYKTKSAMMVSPRDFATFAAWRKESDGSFALIAKSVVSDLIPDVSGSVRGNINLCCFLITPISENECKVVYVFQVDVSGWVPTYLVDKVNQYQPLGILGMRKVLTGKSSNE
eukprot:TRINITY_DN374_c0_g1_i1.p1 TRINITY_DN374_c0_g1~~TRINITY_DN374_c0_g1_i1.p1  ORF type:complete len:211 (+),score=46.02 TRINITY_DN374_c0_g1_i1:17-649(+)